MKGKLKEGGAGLHFCLLHSPTGLPQCPRTDWISGIMVGQEINRHVHCTWKQRGWATAAWETRFLACLLAVSMLTSKERRFSGSIKDM